MPQTIGSLRNGKPIIEVAITEFLPTDGPVVGLSQAASFPVRHYTALVDTGADITCICDHVVRECGLRSYGLANLTGGNGSNKHMMHVINLGIFCEEPQDFEGEPNAVKTLFHLPEPLQVMAIRDNSWFDVIVGTDVLVDHEFRLTKGGGFVLTLG
jgi:hypothetical protein